MRYAKIYCFIWRNKKFRALSEFGKILYVYCLSSPHSNIIGAYHLPLSYAKEDLQVTRSDRITQGLTLLTEKGLIFYDAASDVVVIKNHFKHNPLGNQNQVKAALKALRELPACKVLSFIDISKMNKNYHEPFKMALKNRIAGISGIPAEESAIDPRGRDLLKELGISSPEDPQDEDLSIF